MRLFSCVHCIALVAGLAPGFAQEMTQGDRPPAVEASAPLPKEWLPSARAGQVSLVSGNVDLRPSMASAWADAELNQPILPGAALRTDAGARSEIGIGANTVYLSGSTEIEIASLRDGLTQILLSRGRIGFRLRQADKNDSVEIDLPQGGVWLSAPGSYDIEAGDGERQLRIAVFAGRAHFAGAGEDRQMESGQVTAVSDSTPANAAVTEPAAADAFVMWSRDRDYDESQLAAPYFVSRDMTGYAALDSAGVWKINAQYGPVWFPTASAEWSPYRVGHWSWIAPWGWTWIDDRPWAFAPSHYGRWAMIDEHWAWVPGGYVPHPVYAPAVVAFLGTPGVGLSSEDGATVAWFPLAPGEAYLPSYTRDLDYIRNLNFAAVPDVAEVATQADRESALEMFHEDFANRLAATVVPRSVFVNGRAVAPARVSLPEKRLQDAPVLMASPQIGPPNTTTRVARATATAPPAVHVTVRLARKRDTKSGRVASIQSRDRAQPVILRGAHLHAPSYAGQLRGRQIIVVRVAHFRGGSGKKG